ncbi:unnamed protein product [Rotaria sp. Silwood2]|nr:unnamed protein product [Rotaria sp. Silwood2]CAF2554384.1 unnamed protein product [Rotaria sp. Silwood2]CAF2804932.1 unnamed protein product [Rotaria sp. Silwood2]CAF2961700.1 unnamed protein product [Rotaria sp. Silwood2]CAF3880457.1 unnamed protein product [Rotaria sp. Silwood2]
MASTKNRDEGGVGNDTYSGFFHRSLSPRSFDRLRTEHSDYFYKPKRGPSTCKSNVTITRPIKTFEAVTKLVELLSKGNNTKTSNKQNVEDMESPPLSKKFDDQRSSSHYSSFLSMDGGDLSSPASTNSSAFSSRSNSSISTVAEQETQVIIIDEPAPPLTKTASCSSNSEENKTITDDETKLNSSSPCHVPAIGLNVTATDVHLVLLELYPQNVDYSTIVFQRYLISLIINNEHKDWSILNVDLQTTTEQEANFRLFTLTHEEFDLVLIHLQSFIRYNSLLASSFVLNIALTGEQTNEYESKISSRLNKINLNFDIIQCPAESYMIGLDFFLRKKNRINNEEDDLIEIINRNHKIKQDKHELYPYILVHAEAASTFFYIVHSSSKYSVITSNNLCYKTYLNLMKLLQPGFNTNNDEQITPESSSHTSSSSSSFTIRRSPPISFDFDRQDLCKNCHRSSSIYSSQIPMTSFTHLSQRCFPNDYSISNKPHYIYRGWSNRRTASYDKNITTYDVHTQTDDSFLELSSLQTRLAMRRSLLSMLTMNIALTIKLICKLYPSVTYCMLTGEFFQLEKHAIQDLKIFIQSVMGQNVPHMCQLKREPLISAFGCALPRVYFDVIDDESVLGNDCIS